MTDLDGSFDDLDAGDTDPVDVTFLGDGEPVDPDDGAGESQAAPVEPAFTNVVDFVERYLSQVTELRLSQSSGQAPVWDRQWWRHTGVVARLTALWQAWEGARASKDPQAMSAWWLHHYDPHMRVLMGESGPMSGAPDPSWSGHPALPVESAPDILRQPLGQ